jgi:hypothetical protein
MNFGKLRHILAKVEFHCEPSDVNNNFQNSTPFRKSRFRYQMFKIKKQTKESIRFSIQYNNIQSFIRLLSAISD